MAGSVTKRDLKRMFKGDHRMSLLIDKLFGRDKVVIVDQEAHGFAVGTAIRDTGTTFVKAQANSLDNARTIGVVSKVIDANNFSYKNEGLIKDDQFTRGKSYHLSPTTPGLIEEITTWEDGQVKQLIGHCGPYGLELEIDDGTLIGASESIVPGSPGDETPSGNVDGTNKDFTLSATPDLSTLKVFLNGKLQNPNGEYTIDGKVISFTKVPWKDGWVYAEYIVSAVSEWIRNYTPTGDIDGSNKVFVLSYPAIDCKVWLNGGLLKKDLHYTLVDDTITLTKTPWANGWILVDFKRLII